MVGERNQGKLAPFELRGGGGVLGLFQNESRFSGVSGHARWCTRKDQLTRPGAAWGRVRG